MKFYAFDSHVGAKDAGCAGCAGGAGDACRGDI